VQELEQSAVHFHWETGGFVYRGSYFSDLLAGAYVFGDNVNK